jgi:hypothetical protein
MDPVVAPTSGATLATQPRPAPSPAPEPDGADGAIAPLDGEPRTAATLIALLIATIPLATGAVVWAAPGGDADWTRRVSLAPFDLVLIVIVGWVLLRPRLLADLFRSPSVRWASAALAVVGAVAFAAHPGWLGVAAAIRLLAGLAVIATVARAAAHPAARRLLLGAIAAVGAAQAVLALVQAARGRAFGIEYLDFAGPLYPFGTSRAGRGGLTHPYHLAVFLAVAQGAALLGLRHAGRARRAQLPWLAALVLAGAGIGVTYTRAGAIGQVLLVAALLAGRADRRVLAVGALAIVAGLGIGGLGFGSGWMARGADTTESSGATADSNRSVRLREARELIESEPLVGVGPGRYVEALAETERDELLPAHNVIAHEAAELGIVGGVMIALLLALLGLRALRGGAWTAAIVAPVLPFLLLDAYPYVFATGLAVSAIWLGLVRASLEPATASEPSPTASPAP